MILYTKKSLLLHRQILCSINEKQNKEIVIVMILLKESLFFAAFVRCVDAQRLHPDGGRGRLLSSVEIWQPSTASRNVIEKQLDLTTGGAHSTDNPTEMEQFKMFSFLRI